LIRQPTCYIRDHQYRDEIPNPWRDLPSGFHGALMRRADAENLRTGFDIGRSRQSVDRALNIVRRPKATPSTKWSAHALRGLLAGSGYPYKRNITLPDRVLALRSKWMILL
jgi:hypothetical protein